LSFTAQENKKKNLNFKNSDIFLSSSKMMKFHQVLLLCCLSAAIFSLGSCMPLLESELSSITKYDVTFLFGKHQPEIHLSNATLKFNLNCNGETIFIQIPIRNVRVGPKFVYTHTNFETHHCTQHQLPIFANFHWEDQQHADWSKRPEIWLKRVVFKPVGKRVIYETLYFPNNVQGLNQGLSIGLVRNRKFYFSVDSQNGQESNLQPHKHLNPNVNDWNATVILSQNQNTYEHQYDGDFLFGYVQDHEKFDVHVPFTNQSIGPNKHFYLQAKVPFTEACQLPLNAYFRAHLQTDAKRTVWIGQFFWQPLSQASGHTGAIFYPNEQYNAVPRGATPVVRSWQFYSNSDPNLCQGDV
jgi:hypothetical protein